MNVDYREVTEEHLKHVLAAGKYVAGVEQVGRWMVTTYYRLSDSDRYYRIGQKKEMVHLDPIGRETHYYLNRMYFVEEE